MKKILPLTLIIIVALMSTACSYSINFAVINLSDEPIEVEYTVIFEVESLEDNIKPYKMTLLDWNAWFGNKKDKWIALSPDKYIFEPKNRKCKIKLLPNEVIKILSAHDGMYFAEDYKNFAITNIKISGKNGTIVYEGNQLFKQFEEKNYTNRFITYK